MNKLRNLNNLNEGIHKHWIWGNEDNYYRSCDYLQKINYCIQDLNGEIDKILKPSMKEVVYVIVLIDWVCEATKGIFKILKNNDILRDYCCKNNEETKKAERFFKAIRSFIVAHPLSTNRHEHYGFDGDLICIDIRDKTSPITKVFYPDSNWFYLSLDGLKENTSKRENDFILYVYSKKIDGMKFFKCIGVDFKDLYYVAELQIEKLYDLAKYLNKLKKKDFEVRT